MQRHDWEIITEEGKEETVQAVDIHELALIRPDAIYAKRVS